MTTRPALTLIELILVIVLVSILAVPAILGITAYRQKQALYASADILSSVLSRSHIYAREAKEQKQWGVRLKDNTSYEMISGSPGNAKAEGEFGLASPARFVGGYFEIWFFVDTGEADSAKIINLVVPRGNHVQVVVNKSGTVDIR